MGTCFCGCGRSAGVLNTRTNRLGVRHDRALDAMRVILEGELELRKDPDTSVEDARATEDAIASNEGFVGHGERLRDRLVAFVHRAERAARTDLREVRDWQRQAFRISRGISTG
jgi:hypothetical protein